MASMDKKPKTKNELRCQCRYRPLLGIYGLDYSGAGYLHIMIYKKGRLYGEVVQRKGTVEIRCRECYRWTKISLSMRRDERGPALTIQNGAPEPAEAQGGSKIA